MDNLQLFHLHFVLLKGEFFCLYEVLKKFVTCLVLFAIGCFFYRDLSKNNITTLPERVFYTLTELQSL